MLFADGGTYHCKIRLHDISAFGMNLLIQHDKLTGFEFKFVFLFKLK